MTRFRRRDALTNETRRRRVGRALVIVAALAVHAAPLPSLAFESTPTPPEEPAPLLALRSEVSGTLDTPLVEPLPARREVRVYQVRRGDSLWTIARRFGMPPVQLAEMNALGPEGALQVGRPLKVMVISSPTPAEPAPYDLRGDAPAVYRLRMTDGSPVPPSMVEKVVIASIGVSYPDREPLAAGLGTENLPEIIDVDLVRNHLAVKAGKFQSMVVVHAEKYRLDPALIMAMIHTESHFNPRARSTAPAYGLMQLVPHTAGREAYQTLYGERRKPTPQYLYDPRNNIELGTAYFNILQDRYLAAIADPISRTYCAVAAYHAGPSRVGRAFAPKSSIRLAAPIINALNPQEVYERLVEALPSAESRNYVRKVLARVRLYSRWSFQDEGPL